MPKLRRVSGRQAIRALEKLGFEQVRQRGSAAQAAEELQALWQKMQEQAFLSYKVDYARFDEHADEFAQLSLAGQKRFLLEVLDKNQLYVNLSEMDDADYKVSEEDKRLNRMFYKQA